MARYSIASCWLSSERLSSHSKFPIPNPVKCQVRSFFLTLSPLALHLRGQLTEERRPRGPWSVPSPSGGENSGAPSLPLFRPVWHRFTTEKINLDLGFTVHLRSTVEPFGKHNSSRSTQGQFGWNCLIWP